MKKEEKAKLEQLFKEIKYGNKKKIEELYDKYNKIVYGIAFSILKNKEDSEDVVQIVFLKLYDIDNSKLPKEKAGTWLYTVAKNEALTILRKKHDTVSSDNIYNCENENNEINEFIDKDSYNKLINKLDKREQEIVSLKILSDLTFQEISEILGESSNTIKWRYYKAIHTLKITLSNLGMSIIIFLLGLMAFKNQKKEETIIKDDIKANEEHNEAETETSKKIDTKDEHNNSVVENDEENNNPIVEKEEETEVMENVIVEDTVINNTNYISIGMFSASAIFLILTIFFSIFLAKHQLNVKKKTSK